MQTALVEVEVAKDKVTIKVKVKVKVKVTMGLYFGLKEEVCAKWGVTDLCVKVYTKLADHTRLAVKSV